MKSILKSALVLATLLAAGSTINAVAAGAAKTVKAETNGRTPGKVMHITKAEFDKFICNTNGNAWKYIGDKPCVIDFYATWCGPCKMISPYMDEFAEKYKDQLYVYKIDVDKERELAQMFGAYSIPLVIFVPMNGEPQSQRGALSKEDMEKAVRRAALGLPE